MEINQLLNKTWEDLIKNIDSLEVYPGVYILALTDEDLMGKPIDLNDIFYVGMTNAREGIKGRLNQFLYSIEKGKGHSGGNRFLKDYLHGISFSNSNFKKRFFVAYLCLPCNVEKKERSPEDLRKMGEVAKFEYEVLAYIKEKLNREPELNKK